MNYRTIVVRVEQAPNSDARMKDYKQHAGKRAAEVRRGRLGRTLPATRTVLATTTLPVRMAH